MLHELWSEPDGLESFCLAGPMGDGQRQLLAPGSNLIWTVEAASHFAAMTMLCNRRGDAAYATDFPEIDKKTYHEMGWE
jgi:hypothetical protein